jgi:sec-independent protein translocase protein TatA
LIGSTASDLQKGGDEQSKTHRASVVLQAVHLNKISLLLHRNYGKLSFATPLSWVTLKSKYLPNPQPHIFMNTPMLAGIFGLQGPEMLLIVGLVLLLFGAKKIPELARGLGKSMNEFKRARNEFESEINSAAEESERAAEIQRVKDARLKEERAEAAATAAAAAAATKPVETSHS